MPRNLEGKVIIVTGAGRGIGRDIALLCAKEGAKLVVNDLGAGPDGSGTDAGPANAVADEIAQQGSDAVANTESVTDATGAERIIQQALDSFGGLDAVINNAGILRDAMFHKMSHVDWSAVTDVCLKGSFNVARAAAPWFRKQGSGSYIHFTSTSGLIGSYGQANYSAAKMGIVGLSRSIALDMARFGVRSNCISPFAWTRLLGHVPADTPDEKQWIERMARMSTDKIAPLTAFLASDRATDVTSQIFGVRMNEIFVFSQPRPARSVHRSEGWTIDSIANHAIPAIRSAFTGMERSPDYFSWDPV